MTKCRRSYPIRIAVLPLLVLCVCGAPGWSQENAAASPPPPKVAEPEPTSAEDTGWKFDVAMYGWLTTSVRTTVVVDGTEHSSEANLGDVFDILKFAGFARFEAWNNNTWALFADAAHMRLGDEGEVRLRRGLFSPKFDAEIEFRQTILEFGAMRKFGSDRRSLDILAGARYWRFRNELDLGPIDRDSDKDWLDPMVGARANFKLSEKWRLSLRGDVGGFGVGSGSELTWNAAATFRYQLNDRTDLGFGYRILDMEYEAEENHVLDLQMSGPILGVAFRF